MLVSVLKCSHFGVLLKLVLQSLTEGWETSVEDLQREENVHGRSDVRESLPSVCDHTGKDLSKWFFRV